MTHFEIASLNATLRSKKVLLDQHLFTDAPRHYVIKLVLVQFTNFHNKLQCLSLASFSTPVYCLWERPGDYPRVEGTSLYSTLLALPTIIALGWKSLLGTNTIAYYDNS
jgi:hypothetical protein